MGDICQVIFMEDIPLTLLILQLFISELWHWKAVSRIIAITLISIIHVYYTVSFRNIKQSDFLLSVYEEKHSFTLLYYYFYKILIIMREIQYYCFCSLYFTFYEENFISIRPRNLFHSSIVSNLIIPKIHQN